MTQAEIEAALQTAFTYCEAAGLPLAAQQKAILLDVIAQVILGQDESNAIAPSPSSANESNPLDDLTPLQQQALLQFIAEQTAQNQSWKSQLLNDWLAGRDSGTVQFIRETYGLQWLERVQPIHLDQYAGEITLKLQVGDRIEISNSLWEWVQDEGPCSREWFPCTVVALTDPLIDALPDNRSTESLISCIIRFDNGMEYEIQGIYAWNRYQWRRVEI